jgi:hypothetical protein
MDTNFIRFYSFLKECLIGSKLPDLPLLSVHFVSLLLHYKMRRIVTWMPGALLGSGPVNTQRPNIHNNVLLLISTIQIISH